VGLMFDNIYLEPYNHKWLEFFELEKVLLTNILPSNGMIEIIHFGSTAVPNLKAKPIIDIMITVNDLEVSKKNLVQSLEQNSYLYWEENPLKDRLFFVKGLPPHGQKRTHHIHVFQQGHAEIRKRCKLRDLLISNESIRHEYEELKQKLAEEHKNNREAYTTAKSDFIEKYNSYLS
jgi:GrpB-like predicted nucleotidyltransferase (UPF0157 family)